MTHAMRYLPIERHGMIGDLESVALVGTDGRIDWFCPQRFDAPSMFGALLDAERGGYFQIAPEGERVTSKQLYLPDTAVLITRFFTPDGVGELIDYMPMGRARCAVVRRIQVVRGQMRFRMVCHPAFDYGRVSHRVDVKGKQARFRSPSKSSELVSPTVPLTADGPAATATVTLTAGQRASFILHPAETSARGWEEATVDQRLADTVAFWRRWVAKSEYAGRWREMVHRSAITLKLLTYAPTGATVAAPTTSLPEVVGGERNWDYRYCWVRDSAFTIFAFLRLGFTDEASGYMRWLEQRCQPTAEGHPLQTMYGIDGRQELPEEELPHLEGYKGSRPVRIGNGAWDQLQLDIYGEVMDAVYLSDKYVAPISYDLWKRLREMLDWLGDNWTQPDEGIWEVRGGRREFVYSRLMSWVAFDRAMRLQSRRGLPADRVKWRVTRDRIFEDVMTRGWSDSRRSFVQYYGSDVLDASNLLIPLVRFLGATDPRMLSTLDAIQADLVSDSLVYRYDPERAADDGLDGREGSFSLCSFWYVEALTRAGRLDEARLVFEKMLSYANHVGLYSEEIGDAGEALGNFPQAFTHLGLISAAYDLDRALGGQGWG